MFFIFLTCRHFVRHYIHAGKGYLPLDKGHCRRRRGMFCAADTLACGRYCPAAAPLTEEEWRALQRALAAREK